MSKSKTYIKETAIVSDDYLTAYNMLLEAMQLMMQSCSNYRTEIYNQATLLRTIASRKAYFDNLRDKFADANNHKETKFLAKYYLNIAENCQDNKVCDQIWSEASKMYDNFVLMASQESSNDEGAINMYKTSDEILKKAYEFYENDDINDQKLQDARAELAFSKAF